MILDTIMFVGYANEVDILEFRLEEYYDIVDNFLIIEGTHTFQGDEKPLHFKDVFSKQDRFKKYMDKVEMVTFNSLAKGEESKIPSDFKPNYSDLISSWNDHNQRRLITDVCIDWGLQKDDIVIIGDCDEIYDKQYLPKLLESTLPCAGYVYWSFYYINVYKKDPWGGAFIMNFDPNFDLENTRHGRDHNRINFPYGDNPPFIGWHLSWLGNAEQLATKILSGGHTEINYHAYNLNLLKEKISNLEWFETRGENSPVSRDNDFVVGNNLLPPFFKQDRFKHLFYGEL
jgi:hypothetical protein